VPNVTRRPLSARPAYPVGLGTKGFLEK
jgi:hypothetical protein